MGKKLIFTLALSIVILISWAATVALLWVVAWLMGWEFRLASATATWIIMLILKNVFSGGNK